MIFNIRTEQCLVEVLKIRLSKFDLCFLTASILLEIVILAIISFFRQYDFTFWLSLLALSLGAVPFYLRRASVGAPYLQKRDLWVVIGLIAFAIPIYLFMNDWLPVQVGADEPWICGLTRSAADRHLLGSATWGCFPNFAFILFGKMAQLIGEISISNLRTINGVIGVLIVAALYVFYRTGMGPFASACGALIAGFNHSLIAQSRSCYHSTIDVLIETAAYACLIRAFQTTNFWMAFVGGVVAGTGFYFYFPARSIMLIWGITAGIGALTWQRRSRLSLLKIYAVSFFAFVLTALPQIVALLQEPSTYVSQQLLITQEGMHKFMERYGYKTESEAFHTNVINQLTCLNIPKADAWALYWNPSFAFCDAVTGVLLWAGILVSMFFTGKSESEKWLKTLSLSAFAILMFVYACIISCAPTHTRLIMLLPFIGYMAVNAAAFSAQIIARLLARNPQAKQIIYRSIVVLLTLTMVGGNLYIFRTWLVDGLANGDPLGNVMHYVLKRRQTPNHKWYVISKIEGNRCEDFFFPWASARATESAIRTFAGTRAEVHAIEPNKFCNELTKDLLNGEPLQPPLTIFLQRKDCPCLQSFLRDHSKARIHDITNDSLYVAVEVLE